MYNKTEISFLKREFWTAFGAYLKPVASAEGKMINWINYKTGVKYIYFRMDATKQYASIAIECAQPNDLERVAVFDKLVSLKTIFNEVTGSSWQWENDVYDENGKHISQIIQRKEGVSVFNKNDWPAIISFLKERIIQLDAFWLLVKFHFEL